MDSLNLTVKLTLNTRIVRKTVLVAVVGGGGDGGDGGSGGGGGGGGGMFSVDRTGLGFIYLSGKIIPFVVVCLKTNKRCVVCPHLCDRAINPKAKSHC